MPANGLASSARRTAGSLTRPIPATAATVRRGAIHRATASAAEDITPGKLALQRSQRQTLTAGDGPSRVDAVGPSALLNSRRPAKEPSVCGRPSIWAAPEGPSARLCLAVGGLG